MNNNNNNRRRISHNNIIQGASAPRDSYEYQSYLSHSNETRRRIHVNMMMNNDVINDRIQDSDSSSHSNYSSKQHSPHISHASIINSPKSEKTPTLPYNYNNNNNQSDFKSSFNLIKEAIPSLWLSLCGLILAGSLLDHLQSWTVFKKSELFILVPTLLGLKGNLEMNLASRLSTAANLGLLDIPSSRFKLVIGNMALLQTQAACISGLASLWSLVMSGFIHGKVNNAADTALICASGILTASLTSFALGSAMCGMVIVCRMLKIDPDNIATPVAASLGDLITLLVLAAIASFLNGFSDTPYAVLLIVFMLSLLPFWVWIVVQNEYVEEVLKTGWTPLVVAMSISTIAGLVLERFIDFYMGLAVLVPVLNGVCGNLACVYASRTSTELHRGPIKVILPPRPGSKDYTPAALFFINIITQALFLTVITVLGVAETRIDLQFILIYFSVSSALTFTLLVLVKRICQVLWVNGLDPDDYIFSLITSIGDVMGTVLLVLGFQMLVFFGETNRLVPTTSLPLQSPAYVSNDTSLLLATTTTSAAAATVTTSTYVMSTTTVLATYERQ